MSKEGLSHLENFLRAQDQEAWDRTVQQLSPRMHEVDRQAAQLWVAFWPLKLTRLLEQNPDQDAIIRDYRLKGHFRLSEQIDSSVSFLYGAKFWPQVKADLVGQASSTGEGGLKATVLASAERVAGLVEADSSLLLGIVLVGHLMAAHVGLAAMRACQTQPASLASFHRASPDKICAQRSRQSTPGLFGFLKGADRQFKVRTDPQNQGGFEFRAYQGQDLSMAAKSDTRDYTKVDSRRLEGPIPFECRSGSCGFCWMGVLSPPERLEKITPHEARRLKYFGYVPENAPEEKHPLIRLSCQAHCWGDTQVVVPPWNGALDGRTL